MRNYYGVVLMAIGLHSCLGGKSNDTVRVADSTIEVDSPTGILANGYDEAQITVALRTKDGKPVEGIAVELAATGDGNLLAQPVGPTDKTGIVRATLRSTRAETKTVSAIMIERGLSIPLESTPTVTFVAAAPANLVFQTQPTNLVAGAAISPAVVVRVEDAFGNLVTTATGIISLEANTNPGGATLAGTASVAAAGGLAMFDNLTLYKRGSGYTLVASTPGLSTAASNAFTVVSGAPSTTASTVAANPTMVLANGVESSSVTVTVLDDFANPVPGVTVLLAGGDAGCIVTQPAAVTAANGEATASVVSTTVQTSDFTATIDSDLLLTQTATIAFVICSPGTRQCGADHRTIQLCSTNGLWTDESICTNACLAGPTCGGNCPPASKGCAGDGITPQLCDTTGSWQSQTACTVPNGLCVGGDCTAGGYSCAAMTSNCGPASAQSCCTTQPVAGGSFPMGRSEIGTDAYPGDSAEQPEHQVNMSAFRMDKFEVTVGRFRRFLDNYDGWRNAGNPLVGAGRNLAVEGANAGADTGWKSAWNSLLPATAAVFTDSSHLKCDPGIFTWDTSGTNDNYPINCVNWYEAFAFCIWDGGRLATEAEWEYAAAGAAENRLYPWGSAAPTVSRVNAAGMTNSPFFAVGQKVDGAGSFGQMDLSGSVWEWVLDYYATFPTSVTPLTDPANLEASANRGYRGGGWQSPISELRSAARGNNDPASRSGVTGIRCAR